MQQLDPVLQRIIDDHRRAEQERETARKLAERPALLAKLAGLERERATVLPALARTREAKQAAAWAAHVAAIEAGNHESNEANRISHAIGQVLDALGARDTAEMRTELDWYSAELDRERARLFTGDNRIAHEARVKALDNARYQVAAIGSLQDAEIPARIRAIRATLPPSVGADTVDRVGNIKRLGANIRAGLAARFTT